MAAFPKAILYQVVAALELFFSVLLLVFGVNTLVTFLEQSPEFKLNKEMIQYAAIAAISNSTLQIILCGLLVMSSIRIMQKNSQPPINIYSRGEEVSAADTRLPWWWYVASVIQVAALLFIFLAPVNLCIQNDEDLQIRQHILEFEDGMVTDALGQKHILPPCFAATVATTDLRSGVAGTFTYTLTSLLFKWFIWVVSLILRLTMKKGPITTKV